MALFVERTFLKVWKSHFEVQSCLETIIVVEQAVLPGSVRSLGIEVLIVYVAREDSRFENMELRNQSGFELSSYHRKPVIG